MKKLILLLLIMGFYQKTYSAAENFNPTSAAKILTDEMSKYITGHNDDGFIFMNGKIVFWDLRSWNRILINTFSECDEMSIKLNDADLKKTCYINIVNSFTKWTEASSDENISNYVWRASAGGAFSAQYPHLAKVDFNVWLINIPKYKKQELTNQYYDRYMAAREPLYKETLRIKGEINKEESKLFKNKKKIEDLKWELSQAGRRLEKFSTEYQKKNKAP